MDPDFFLIYNTKPSSPFFKLFNVIRENLQNYKILPANWVALWKLKGFSDRLLVTTMPLDQDKDPTLQALVSPTPKVLVSSAGTMTDPEPFTEPVPEDLKQETKSIMPALLTTLASLVMLLLLFLFLFSKRDHSCPHQLTSSALGSNATSQEWIKVAWNNGPPPIWIQKKMSKDWVENLIRPSVSRFQSIEGLIS